MDLDVHVGVLPAQQTVPDEAPHIVGPASQGGGLPGDGPGGLHIPGRVSAAGHRFCRRARRWSIHTST